jgi:hypothetical protein
MLAPDKKNNRFESWSEVAQRIPITKILCHNIWWQYYDQCILGLQGLSIAKYHATQVQNQ